MSMLTWEARKQFKARIETHSRMRLVVHPNSEDNIELIKQDQLERTLLSARVHTPGDSFPRVNWDGDTFKAEAGFIEGYYAGRANSIYRLYRSAQFVYIAGLEEDDRELQMRLRDALDVDEKSKSQMGWYLNVIWHISRVVDYFLFARSLSRFCPAGLSWRIEISLLSPGIRALSMDDIRRAGLWNLYFVENEDIHFECVLSASELQLEPSTWCIAALKHFDQKFGFENREENLQEIIAQVQR